MNHKEYEGSRRKALTLLLITLLFLPLTGCEPHANRIVVGSKNFTEQLILGEMFAQVIEARTQLPVERRFYLAGTFICQQAILAGRIDVYPEYTGTALTAVLKQQPSNDKREVYRRVQQEYKSRFGLTVGPPLGFDDTFAMVIRGDDARREGRAIGLGRVPPGFLQVRRRAQQLQRRVVAAGGSQGARGSRRQGGRPGDHPRGQ